MLHMSRYTFTAALYAAAILAANDGAAQLAGRLGDEPPAHERSRRVATVKPSAPSPGSASLHVASGVESEVRDETCTSQENDCDNDVHGYSSSKFAMADSIRVCSE